MTSYCAFAASHTAHEFYHDHEHGVPSREESVLFERLCMEIMQAGLSWDTVLRRRETMRTAFEGYDVDRIAAYGAIDKARLLADTGIIRNRLKVEAIIANAIVVKGMRATHCGFAGWLDAHHPLDQTKWVKLFRATFRFTGTEIVNEFLTSLGWLPGAHSKDCPAFARIALLNPPCQSE